MKTYLEKRRLSFGSVGVSHNPKVRMVDKNGRKNEVQRRVGTSAPQGDRVGADARARPRERESERTEPEMDRLTKQLQTSLRK